MAMTIRTGQKVEVMNTTAGLKNSYFEAKVLEIRDGRCRIRYKMLVNYDRSPLIEEVPLACIRPYPPALHVNEFDHGDTVDAWFNDGRWKWEIIKYDGYETNSKYIVKFDGYTDENGRPFIFYKKHLRMHQDPDLRDHTCWNHVKSTFSN